MRTEEELIEQVEQEFAPLVEAKFEELCAEQEALLANGELDAKLDAQEIYLLAKEIFEGKFNARLRELMDQEP